MPTCLAVVLAAGEGTRMRSALPKVLHPVGGLPMLAHVLASVLAAGADSTAVVVGPNHEAVVAAVGRFAPGASMFVQKERLGTAHAVLAAQPALMNGADHVLVVFGDTPFVRPETIRSLRDALDGGASVAVAGMRPDDPYGYGRLLTEGERLLAIREEKDASEAERRIGLCNGGLMAINGARALELLDSIGNSNAQKEYYLTDIVEIANARGLRATAVEVPTDEAFGINTRAHLAEAEQIFQNRRREEHLAGGATMIAPQTVFFSHDTRIGTDVVIEPNVVFGPGVTIGNGVTIRAFSHFEGAKVADGAILGPFARLRPGAAIGEGAHIGNFVEIKAADVAAGAKINHLAYVGDASVGSKANIGAGAITGNYDGVHKHRTTIGANAFIGSNAVLVAPVTIGDGAYVASGSVITENVEPDALAVARGRQVAKAGWAAARRKPRQ